MSLYLPTWTSDDVRLRAHLQALLVTDSAEKSVQRHLIVKLAEQARLPALYSSWEFESIGGLTVCAVDVEDQFRRAAIYVDAIVEGRRDTELPTGQIYHSASRSERHSPPTRVIE